MVLIRGLEGLKAPAYWKLTNLLFSSLPDSSKGDDAFYTREKEIAEIESLLPEIREKIQDTKDMEAESLKKLGEQKTVEEGVKATEEEGPLTNGGNRRFTLVWDEPVLENILGA